MVLDHFRDISVIRLICRIYSTYISVVSRSTACRILLVDIHLRDAGLRWTSEMTDIEIWQTIQAIRNTLIQAHVKLNEAMDEIDKLLDRIRRENLDKGF